MHDLIEKNLESCLEDAVSGEVKSHLSSCRECSEAVAEMRTLSASLKALRTGIPIEPAAAFRVKVMDRIRRERQRGVWSIFTLDPGFVSKVAFASLLTLAALGGYLVTQPTDAVATSDHTPEAVLASHDVSTASGDPQHSDGLLLTLASYQGE